MEEGAGETTDRETVVETHLQKLEWAGIEIDRRRYRNNNLQPTTAASAAMTTPIPSPEGVPCSTNKATAISRAKKKATIRVA